MQTDPEQDYRDGHIPFLGVDVYLDSRPLIPRTETEYWVEQVINELKNSPRPIRVLDIFAGSGCIGLAVLMHTSNTHVTFSEKEARHFPTIQKSLEKNKISEDRATYIESDVWSAVDGKFDAILANPPYISKERDTAAVSTAVEPDEALYAPDDGFYFIERFIEGLSAHLKDGGEAWIEHEPFQVQRLDTLAQKFGIETKTNLDQYSVERYTKLRKKVVA